MQVDVSGPQDRIANMVNNAGAGGSGRYHYSTTTVSHPTSLTTTANVCRPGLRYRKPAQYSAVGAECTADTSTGEKRRGLRMCSKCLSNEEHHITTPLVVVPA